MYRILCLTFMLWSVGHLHAQTETDSLLLLYNGIKSASTVEKKEILVKQMQHHIQDKEDEQEIMLLDASIYGLVQEYAEKGRFDKTRLWITQIRDLMYRSAAVHRAAVEFLHLNRIEEARALLQPEVDKLSKGSNGGLEITPSDSYIAMAYGELLYKEGDFEGAVKLFSDIMEKAPEMPSNYAELYGMALIKVNKDTQLEEKIASVFMADGKRSDEFSSLVKAWLNERSGSDQAYQELLKKATPKEEKRIVDKVAGMATSEASPDFSIKNAKGQDVSLISLRGKTVIMDFWATWCGPCVASFPGMQRAVDYFKDRDDVVFMFIHTAERVSPEEATAQALALVRDKGYTSFDVYMDLKDPISDKNPLLESFRVSALPTKLVLNKDGVIKFKNTGFVEEHDAVEEIKLMVELANKD